jgi:hypothetical protein
MNTPADCKGCLMPAADECPFHSQKRAWASELGCTAYADSLYTIADREKERREYLKSRGDEATSEAER